MLKTKEKKPICIWSHRAANLVGKTDPFKNQSVSLCLSQCALLAIGTKALRSPREVAKSSRKDGKIFRENELCLEG